MWDVSGVTGAAPIWRDLMDFLHKNVRSRPPSAPIGLVVQRIEYRPEFETTRNEWFIAGTQSPVIEILADSNQLPKIRYPGNGTIIAIDPDIPADNQRMFFQARAGKNLMWQLDDVASGAADVDFSWQPIAGAHLLRLVDKEGKVVDAVRFHVRGAQISVSDTGKK